MADKTGKDWELLERAVASLERALSPDAVVEHNKQLPDLVTGSMRQFDVVIRTGSAHRRQVTVVEVQKRGRKVTIGDYSSWIKKRDDVGANCLICVSEAGFPESVRADAAARQGPHRVHLLTLAALEAANWPVRIVNNAVRVELPLLEVSRQPQPLRLGLLDAAPPPGWSAPPPEVLAEEKLFLRDNGERLSIQDLLSEVPVENWSPVLDKLADGDAADVLLERTYPRGHLFLSDGVHRLEVSQLKTGVRIRQRAWWAPVSVREYRADGAPGPTAWVAISQGEFAGQAIDLRVVISQDDAGLWQVIGAEGSGAAGLLTLGGKRVVLHSA